MADAYWLSIKRQSSIENQYKIDVKISLKSAVRVSVCDKA